MKINPMHSVQAYRKLQETQQKLNNDKTQRSDKVEISSEAQEMAKGNKISPERQEKVEAVKQQIEDGTYKIDHKEVAKKFYEFWDR